MTRLNRTSLRTLPRTSLLATGAWIFVTALSVGATGTSAHAQSQATAPSHAMHTGSSPYSAMAASACKEPTIECGKAAMPYFAADGALWVIWSAAGAVSVARSTDLGKTFAPRIEIAQHGAFLDTGPDARPQLVGDKQGNLIAAYSFFRDKQWNAQVNIATSKDKGHSFSTPESITQDPSSQRFASLAVGPDSKVFASWIDKRLVAADIRSGKKRSGGSIAYAWSDAIGQSFKTEHIANPDTCECCRIAVAMGPSGLPVILYRAIFDRTTRDHASQAFTAREQPGPIQRVSTDDWKTDVCPHHGPALTISPAGTLHAAWFTQGAARTGIFYARSADQGAHYSAPRAIGNPQAQPGRPYLLAQGQNVWLVWKEFDGKRAAIFMQYSIDDGLNWSDPAQVAQSVGYSDHPLLIALQDKVYLSWLTASEGYRLIELKHAP